MRKRSARTGNQKKLGIIVAAFFGFILLTSTVLIAIPSILPPGTTTSPDEVTITGTPQDNYPDADRMQYCGISQPQSTAYITEYGIHTPCTQPLAVEVTPNGQVWFAQSNTGNLAVFDPVTEEISEFDNPFWDDSQQSMIWGMDYEGGYIWYTDEANDSVWRFDTSTGTYRQFQLPSSGDAFPQLLEVVDTDIILNDLTGNSLVVLDASDVDGEGLVYYAVPSNVTGAVTAGFAPDADGTIWYTTWVPQGGGVLVNVDPDLIKLIGGSEPLIATLPVGLRTPNGVTVDNSGTVWLADTSSSYFFSYNPMTDSFSHYATNTPDVLSYGNVSGMIQTPVSRPYWMATTDTGQVVFNEQTANRIAVMDPRTEKLVEYNIPSRNPFWSDCGGNIACGISQNLAFDVSGDRVWFTEWVENNIGVVDIARPLPFDIIPSTPNLVLSPGESAVLSFAIVPDSDSPMGVEPLYSHTHTFLYPAPHEQPRITILEGMTEWSLDVVAEPNSIPGEYKILVGAEGGSVAVSKYITVQILPQ